MSNIFEKDKLGREPIIRSLTSLIESDFELNVLAVNASWGMGKTTFVEMWKKYLDSKDIPNLYFSAWEDDYSNEPLIAILGEIQNYIQQNQTIEAKAEKIFAETIKKIAKIGIKGGWELAKGFLQQKCGGGYDKFMEIVCEEFEKSVENYSEEKTLLKEIKENIKQIFQQITDKKFVIFIDELDRCRPLYAIELLERVKHLFGTSGVVFVLSIDKEQLGESIKSQYGNIDTNQYLKRFFDLEYHLNTINQRQYQEFLYESIKKDIHYNLSTDERNLALIETISNYKNLTLRELEQFFNQIKIIVSLNKDMYREGFAMRVVIILVLIEVEKLSKSTYAKISHDLTNDYRKYYQNKNTKILDFLGVQFKLIFKCITLVRNKSDDCPDSELSYFEVVSEIYNRVRFLENFTK